MCGLVAVISKARNGFSNSCVDTFSQLLFADQLRGKDGTGVFFNIKKNEGKVRIMKGAVKSSIFMTDKQYIEIEKTLYQEANFAVGHNRSATRGSISPANTHPFREGKIVLVHNGTLTSHRALNKDSDVDSHAICHHMNANGYKETLKKIDGAFALIWSNTEDGTLNFCRNYQRPLYLIETDLAHIAVSELELGIWIATRNNLKVLSSFQLEPRKVYTFHIDDMTKYTTEDVEYLPYNAPAQSNWNAQSNWKSRFEGLWPEDKGTSTVPTHGTPPAAQKGAKNSILQFKHGEKVRFRSTTIRRINNSFYLEGDILKFQHIPAISCLPNDYEDEFRIKYFGSEAECKVFANEEQLVGNIMGTSIYDGRTTYTVTNVRQWSANEEKTEVKNIFAFGKDKRKEEKVCAWCGDKTDKLFEMHGYEVCQTCAEPLDSTSQHLKVGMQ